MPPPNICASTRKSNNKSTNKKEPQNAHSKTPHYSPRAPASASPSRKKGLPAPPTPPIQLKPNPENLSQQVTIPQQAPPSDVFDSQPEDPWHLTFNELKTMRARMGTLEKVEAASLNFAQKLQAISARTNATETKISHNAEAIQELKKEILKLRETVDNQQITIQNLHKVKDEFTQTSRKTVSEMNSLLEQQRQQVESLQVIRQDIKTDVQHQKDQLEALKVSQQESQESVQQQFKDISEDMDHKSMEDQAFQNRHNIIITGLTEDDTHNAYSTVTNFIKNQLKLKKMVINGVYRLGYPPLEGNPYIRPLLIKFNNLPDQNRVWRMCHDIPQTDDQQAIKIQADLPKKLRDGIPILY